MAMYGRIYYIEIHNYCGYASCYEGRSGSSTTLCNAEFASYVCEHINPELVLVTYSPTLGGSWGDGGEGERGGTLEGGWGGGREGEELEREYEGGEKEEGREEEETPHMLPLVLAWSCGEASIWSMTDLTLCGPNQIT